MLREIEPLAAKRETLSYEIAEQLKRSIYSGDYAPGAVLRETELASEYESSRTAVRDALRILEGLRLVELHSWRKANVVPLDRTLVREIYELRALHEAFAVSQGVAEGKFTSQRIAEIKSFSKLFHKLVVEREGGGAAKADLALHRALCSPYGNKSLFRRVEIDQALVRLIILHTSYYDCGIADNSIDDHSRIIAAIVAGDAARVEREVREHIDVEGKVLSEMVLLIEEEERSMKELSDNHPDRRITSTSTMSLLL